MKAAFMIAVAACLGAAANALDIAQMKVYADIVNQVNNDPSSTWTAELDSSLFDKDATSFKNMMGALPSLRNLGASLPEQKFTAAEIAALPTDFLAATNWPECAAVMNTVHDQSACGSCWAVSTAAAATERHCIATKSNVFLSSRDILSCCTSCGDGCEGGWPDEAWSWIKKNGIASGSPSSTNHTACVAYPFPTCKHHTEGSPQCSEFDFSTPKCQKACDSDATYSSDYASDKSTYRSKSAVSIYGEANMMAALVNDGPMTVAYTVYEDFMTYKSGIYQHKSGSALGGHAVVLVGYGTDKETGTKYWIIKNNWNSFWGEQGYFRIVRGNNHCGIESEAAAGVF